MIKRFMNMFRKPELTPVVMEKPERPKQYYRDTTLDTTEHEKLEQLWEANFKNSVHTSIAMDSKEKPTFAMDNQLNIKGQWGGNTILPTIQILWYAQQTFIGYQLCSMLAQNWLISKACLMPAKDATRNGFEISVSEDINVPPEVVDAIKKGDARYKLNKNLIELVQMGRIFGIRIALFNVRIGSEQEQDEYYLNPFNPDAVTPGSYQGISQIDPYWITPQLDDEAAGNPASINFYEPTWWIINGKKVHRTHLVIYRTEEVSDILKPTYIFGGIPIPQKIAQRVYASEKTADEAPMLAMTKRLDIVKMDLAKAAMNPVGVVQRLQEFTQRRDNFGVKTIDLSDELQQFDTSLADLDAVIMTQYQLVAAAANVPSVKLLGTPPKGFNATGEFEEANYHEELESIQAHDLTPLIERHHLLLIRSEIAPKFGIEPFETIINWNELDAMTTKEQAEINKINAETGLVLVNSGAIDGKDEQDRLRNDPKSGYINLTEEKPDEGNPFGESPLSGA
jgi:phage-related protein (TIGR01555 family)